MQVKSWVRHGTCLESWNQKNVVLIMPSIFDVDEPANRAETVEELDGWVVSIQTPEACWYNFCLQTFTREELITLFGLESERVIVTYWGVDAMFAQVQRSFAGRCRLIFYGSLAPKGNLWFEALARVASLGQRNWILKVAGWDHEEQVKHASMGLAIRLFCSVI